MVGIFCYSYLDLFATCEPLLNLLDGLFPILSFEILVLVCVDDLRSQTSNCGVQVSESERILDIPSPLFFSLDYSVP